MREPNITEDRLLHAEAMYDVLYLNKKKKERLFLCAVSKANFYYALGLRFGKVCEQKVFSCFSHVGQFSWVFLAFWIPTCWYQIRKETRKDKRKEKLKNASETTHSVIRP